MIDRSASDPSSKPVQEDLENEVFKLIEVRNMCLAVRADAHVAATETGTAESYLRYVAARDRCIDMAQSISDGFYRDTALHLVYDLCKRANDHGNAQIALSRIEHDMIRGHIADGRPALFD